MRPTTLPLTLLLATLPAAAQTTLYATTAISPLRSIADQGHGGGCSNLTQGQWIWLTAQTSSGTQTPAFMQPTSSPPPCPPHNGSQHLRWISPPLANPINLTGNYDYQLRCMESAGQLNLGARFRVLRWNRTTGGIDLLLDSSATTTECGTTAGNRTIAAHAPTCGSACNLAAGDRLVLLIDWMAAGGSWGGNSSRGATLYYGDAQTFWRFADSLTFAADTNNARPIPGGAQ